MLVLGRGALALNPTAKDSRALARAIVAAAPAPLDEVLFVETQPRYGVSLYIDAEVERVDIYPRLPSSTAASYEPLSREITLDEGNRAFVVSSEDIEAFRMAMRAYGLEVVERGSWRQLSFVWTAE